MPARTATRPAEADAVDTKPLTDAERKKMDEFLARAAAEASPHGPAVRLGRAYVALVNLSMPRREQAGADPKDRQNDLVYAGDTVYLTDDEAAKFLRHGERDGRRVAVIRLKSEVDTGNVPKPPPSLLSGPIFRAGPAIPGTDMPRPDPAGSTRIVTQESVPESNPLQPAPGGNPSIVDAMDILPGGQLARDQVSQGADQDLLSAVKAQAGMTRGE